MKALALLALTASLAAAEPRDPTFDSLSLGRLTPLSTIAFDFGFEVWDEPANTETNVYTINIAGHFVNRRGIGGYFTVPLTYLDLQAGPVEDSEMAFGNVEAGGIYTKLFGRSTALLLHAGVALPTAEDDGAAALQFIGSFTRLPDVALHVTNSTWLRTGISGMGRANSLVWRADFGLDLALDEDDAVHYSPIWYVNVGGGIDLGSATLLAELANVISDADDNSDDSASTFTFGARFASGTLRPGIGILLPIDFDGADNFEWALVGSLAVRIPSL
jgi:hypothetical protein